MNHSVWNMAKMSKSFYVQIYRRALFFLLGSLLLNVFLLLLIRYVYLNRPEPHFYASDGVTPPIQLTPLSLPNYSSKAMLPEEEQLDEAAKPIPK